MLPLLLPADPVHQEFYVPLRAAQRQELPAHNDRAKAQILARLGKRKAVAGLLEHPAIRRHLPPEGFPLLPVGGLHLGTAKTAVPVAQFTHVVVRPHENLCTEPLPAVRALLKDVLVVVFLYGDGNH